MISGLALVSAGCVSLRVLARQLWRRYADEVACSLRIARIRVSCAQDGLGEFDTFCRSVRMGRPGLNSHDHQRAACLGQRRIEHARAVEGDPVESPLRRVNGDLEGGRCATREGFAGGVEMGLHIAARLLR